MLYLMAAISMKGNLGSRWRLRREDKETQRYYPLSLPGAAGAELRLCLVGTICLIMPEARS